MSPLSTESRHLRKAALLAAIVALGFVAYWLLGSHLSLESIAQKESQLRDYQRSHPILVIMVAVAVYVAVVGLSLPGATAMTLAYGWYFGFLAGFVMVSFAATAGATLAFLMTRYLLRDFVQNRYAGRLSGINEAFEREGAFYLFSLRLIPAVPFFVINAVMGLTRIHAVTFWWVSQLGMLPGTAAYVYAGASVPSLKELSNVGLGSVVRWQLLLAFALIGLLPLIVKRLVAAKPIAVAGDQIRDQSIDG